jgi:hypothetical protein
MNQENWWLFLLVAVVLVFLWRYLLILGVAVGAFVGSIYAIFLYKGNIAIEWRIAGAVVIFVIARYVISILDDEAGGGKGRSGNQSSRDVKQRTTCSHCMGTGRITCSCPGYEVGRTGICGACYGTGVRTCPYCSGRGHYG